MTIEEALSAIKNAVYGKDVRQAMHDGILQAEGGAGTVAKKAEASAKKAAKSAKGSEIASKAIEGKADQAVTIARSANSKSDSTQSQLNEIVINGDSSVEAAQARVDIKNISYATLKDRLDKEQQEVNAQLAQNINYSTSTFNYLSDARKQRKPIVSFIADDAPKSDLTKLLPIIQEKNVPVGIGVITSRVGKDFDFEGTIIPHMDWEDIKLMSDNGVEIMAHTHEHRDSTTLTEDILYEDIVTNKRILSEHGYLADGFIYPYNSFNSSTKNIVKKVFKYSFARYTSNSPDIDNNSINRHSLGAYYDIASMAPNGDTTSLEYYKYRVDKAIENNDWLVFVIHTHMDQFPQEQQQHMRDIIDYIRSLDVDIVYPREGFEMSGNIIQTKNMTLDANGNTKGSLIPVTLTDEDAYSLDDPITAFPGEHITITPISQENSGEINARCALFTYRLKNGSIYNQYQEIQQFAGTVNADTLSVTRKRYFNGSDFSKWVENSRVIIENFPTVVGGSVLEKPLTDYQYKSVTITPISQYYLDAVPGFPTKFPGNLKTVRTQGASRLSDNWHNSYREYSSVSISGNTPIVKTYRQYFYNNAWTDWVLLTSTS